MKLVPSAKRLIIKEVEQLEEKTASGLVLPTSVKEEQNIAEVVAVGHKIEKDEDKSEFVKVGSKIIYSQFAGTNVKLNDEEYIIINFDDILAVVQE